MITSVELMFAKLQSDLAEENHEHAKTRIDGIKDRQADQKALSDLIVALRSKIDVMTRSLLKPVWLMRLTSGLRQAAAALSPPARSPRSGLIPVLPASRAFRKTWVPMCSRI